MKENKFKAHATAKKKAATTYRVETKENLLDSLLNNLAGKKRKLIKAVLRDRQVQVEGKVVTQFDFVVIPGQDVTVSWERATESVVPRDLKIVHIDADIVVIDKPAGLLTVATEKEKRKTAFSLLQNYLREDNPENKIYTVHTLDRDSSGLMLFARSESVREQLLKKWKEAGGNRTYIGVVEGDVDPPEGRISSWLSESSAFVVYSSKSSKNGKKAVTRYRRIKTNGELSLVEINPETSRKHQIRVHLQDIGHPLVGDKKYGAKANFMGRLALHSMVLSFHHPVTGEPCHFDTGVPRKFSQLFSS